MAGNIDQQSAKSGADNAPNGNRRRSRLVVMVFLAVGTAAFGFFFSNSGFDKDFLSQISDISGFQQAEITTSKSDPEEQNSVNTQRNAKETIEERKEVETEEANDQLKETLKQSAAAYVETSKQADLMSIKEPVDNSANEARNRAERLNIVLLYADDWTAKTLGMRNPLVKTPHLDELARNGILFRQNAVTTSVCMQSRATLYTGLYLSQHQQFKIAGLNMFSENVDWSETLFPLIKKSGYHSGFVGKWHHDWPPKYMSGVFDYAKTYYGKHWYDSLHCTQKNEDDALEFLQNRPSGKPFSLMVSFFATHALDGNQYPEQYQPQNASMKTYINEDIVPPETMTPSHWERMPKFYTERFVGRHRWKKAYFPNDHFDLTIRNYYRMATEVDTTCGRIIEELKKQGVYNNTLVIFTTDNGNLHGQHELAEKWIGFEESLRVPLIVRDPRMTKTGVISDAATLSIDLTPTLLSAARATIPDFMQGRDMSNLYLGSEASMQHYAETWRRDFFYEYMKQLEPIKDSHSYDIPDINALVTPRYKYIFYPEFEFEEMFDLEQDPMEENDLLKDTSFNNPELLQQMKGRFQELKDWVRSGHPV